MTRSAVPVEVHPATPDRWDDVQRFAGDRGFYSGCWCMWWRLPNKTWQAQTREERRAGLETLVCGGREPGLLAYLDGEPVGWVALAPRTEYERLERSPKLGPVDDEPVWSIVCFTIDRRHRRRGIGEALLAAACDHARRRGASIVEGYPIDTSAGKKPSAELYTGTLSMFLRAGFEEVARRGGRPIVRRPA